jgi:sugar O-acyltransferase (sialic acid O-acetyltransferase NeuD family)
MFGDGVGLLGAGRQALETAGYLREAGIGVAFFVEEMPPDYARGHQDSDAPVYTFERDLRDLAEMPVVASVGDPGVRRRLVERWPGNRFLTLVSERAWVAADTEIGEGTVVAPMAAVNRYCTLGMHVLINVGAVVSHDVVVGDCSTISPGCTVGGLVGIGRDVFLGIGSTIRDRVTIGDGAFVAAGAVVIEDVDDHQVVMGVPASPRERIEERR